MNKSIELSIYHHSAERYNTSFKLNHFVYWGRIHRKTAKSLKKPSLLFSNSPYSY